MLYQVVLSKSGVVWWIQCGDKNMACVHIGLYKTKQEAKDFADKVCGLLNERETNSNSASPS